MKKKIVGILTCTLLITATAFSVMGIDENRNKLNYDYISYTSEVSKSLNQDDDWPMFRHDLNNTGYSPSLAPDDDTLLWSKDIGYWVESKPTIKDERVYIVGIRQQGGADVYCLNPFNGTEIWKTYQPSDEVSGSPTVANGRVYVLGIYYYLYCYDAYTGDILWKVQAYGEGSPMVVDDKLYFGCSAGDKEGFYCLNATTGEEIWVFDTLHPYSGCTPAIVNGKVYIGNGWFLYCLNADTGAEIWNSSDKCDWASPVVFNGKVYTNFNQLYCLDADNGNQLWAYPIGSYYSTPAVAYGHVYLPTDAGIVYALDVDTGDLIWSSPQLAPIRSDATVADDKVYINSGGPSSPAKFVCLDAYTGEIIWDYIFGGMYGTYCSSAVAYGNVYVCSNYDGYIYAFGTPNEPPEKPSTPDGPVEGESGVEYTFNSSTTDPEGGDIYYLFDWDDGTNSGWIGPYTSGAIVNASHIWKKGGDYEIRVEAHDGRRESNWSDPLTIHIVEENLPPNKPVKPKGKTNGKVNIEYTYTTNTIDPDGNQIYYWFDWGDGNNSGWVGPYASGATGSAKHTWTEKGTYQIKVKAKDIFGGESDWSDLLSVTMPRNRLTDNLLLRFIENHPLLYKIFQFHIIK